MKSYYRQLVVMYVVAVSCLVLKLLFMNLAVNLINVGRRLFWHVILHKLCIIKSNLCIFKVHSQENN